MNLHRKVGDNINIKKMINMLLQKLSLEYDVFYMEKRNYRDGKTYKTFTAITLGDITDLLSIDNNTFASSLEDTIIIWKY